MDDDAILEALQAAIDDERTLAGIASATGIPENSLSQFRGPKRSLGKPFKAALIQWLQSEGYLLSESDPIEDVIGFLRKALEFAQKRQEPRRKRAAVWLHRDKKRTRAILRKSFIFNMVPGRGVALQAVYKGFSCVLPKVANPYPRPSTEIAKSSISPSVVRSHVR